MILAVGDNDVRAKVVYNGRTVTLTLLDDDFTDLNFYEVKNSSSISGAEIDGDITASGSTITFNVKNVRGKIGIDLALKKKDAGDQKELPFHNKSGLSFKRVLESDVDWLKKNGFLNGYENSISYNKDRKAITFRNIKVDGNWETYESPDGTMCINLNKDIKHIIMEDDVELPKINDEYVISAYAFRNCTSLESITILSVVVIGYRAFEGCTSLREITLPEAESFKDWAFRGCTSLREITTTSAIMENLINSYSIYSNGETIPTYTEPYTFELYPATGNSSPSLKPITTN